MTCHDFLRRYGMSNWRDKQVRPEQVDLQTSFTENDKKEALVGSFGGRLYLAYRERRERMAATQLNSSLTERRVSATKPEIP